MKLVIERHALRDLRKAPRRVVTTIRARLNEIAANPFGTQRIVTVLKGSSVTFRLRTGAWRTLYEVDREADVVRVLTIKPRGEVYR